MVKYGVNINNREPLLADAYSIHDLLDLSVVVEEKGFDSVWVGDSLFSKPRYEPLSLMAAVSQRTSKVKLGTACLVTAMRNPLYLALEWATLDVISNGRTILGACMGSPEVGVRREYKALGLDFSRRASIFEEGLDVVRQLWTEGTVNLQGEHFQYEDISVYSGTEMGPLMPIQKPPPMWVVSNPRLIPKLVTEKGVSKVVDRASNRIAKYGDGWMTCCRARHPEEFESQLNNLKTTVQKAGRDISEFTMSYQVTMNVADTKEAAQEDLNNYINTYYPELSQAMDLGEWGPVGTPEQIAAWIHRFKQAGVNYFICRFGALDQFGQVERFAKDVLPLVS